MRGRIKEDKIGICSAASLSHLRPSQATELLRVEVDPEADALSRLQNPPRLRHAEHSLLAEHVDVLDGEGAAPVEPLNLGKLLEDDILGGLLGARAPGTREESSSDSLSEPHSIRVTFLGRPGTRNQLKLTPSQIQPSNI